MGEPEIPAECDDEPKLTAEEWAAVVAYPGVRFSLRDVAREFGVDLDEDD